MTLFAGWAADMGRLASVPGHARRFLDQPPSMRSAYLMGGLHYLSSRGFLVHVLRRLVPDASTSEIRHALATAGQSEVVVAIRERRAELNGALSDHEISLLYAVVLLKRPALVVETGVAHGSSSWAILSAMEKTGVGRLVSIDMPMVEQEGEAVGFDRDYRLSLHETSVVASFSDVGHLVPPQLRDRWTLHLGDSLVVLPEVLNSIERVDVFLHDSLHTYDHMMAEFRFVWPKLGPHGIILADDIFVGCHQALQDFAASAHAKFINYRGMGALINLYGRHAIQP